MVETEWPELGGKTVTYHDHTWELTGSVDVQDTGELLAVEAKQVDDVKQPAGTLRFGCGDRSPSLNPGDLGEHFDRLERTRSGHYLVVSKDPRTYRYELLGVEYE